MCSFSLPTTVKFYISMTNAARSAVVPRLLACIANSVERCKKKFWKLCGSWLPSYFLFAFLVFVLLLPFCGILFLGLLFIRELFVSNSLSSSTWFNDGVNTRGSSTLNALRMFSTWQLYSKQATDQSANDPLSEFICSLTHLANVEFNRLINKSGFSLVSGVGVADFDDMKKITGAVNQCNGRLLIVGKLGAVKSMSSTPVPPTNTEE